MNINDFRQEIKTILNTFNTLIESSLKQEVIPGIKVSDDDKLRFEICPYFLRIHLVQTEEDIIDDDIIHTAIDQKLDMEELQLSLNIHQIINEETVLWFAARWETIEGSSLYSPAYIFFHGPETRLFDLEQKCWFSAREIWDPSSTT